MKQKSLQKLEKGPSNNIWLWRQPPNSMTMKMLEHGTASQSAICLGICVIEPVKAGTQKILGITETKHLPSQWQPWVSRELAQTKNPWQKPFSSGGCPASNGLHCSARLVTNEMLSLQKLVFRLVPSLKKLSFQLAKACFEICMCPAGIKKVKAVVFHEEMVH